MKPSIPASSLPDIPEHYLHWAWSHLEFLRFPLVTLQGDPLEIDHPGQPNPDNGPDFFDAELRIAGIRLRGDVECHLHWQDWFRHGHHLDRRYQQVRLHVLWHPPGDISPALRQRFAHLVLSGFLSLPLENWLEKMERLAGDTESSPATPEVTSLSREQVEELAWERFQRKCAWVRTLVSQYGWETGVYIGLARALGYRQNSQPFEALVRTLTPERLFQIVHPLQRSPLLFWILLAQQAGLLQRPFRRASEDSPSSSLRVIQRVMRDFAGKLPFQSLSLTQWYFSRLRPANNPYQRLAGYAQLLYHYQESGLFSTLLEPFMSRSPLSQLLPGLQGRLCLPLNPELVSFLSEFLGFRHPCAHTMGVQRCRQFILNILLPLYYLWSVHQGSPGFQIYLEDLYFHFPAVEENAVVRHYAPRISSPEVPLAFIQQAYLEHYQRHHSAALSPAL
ncbi:MAG: DUF2851 family protein [Calditrichia bacterium]